MTWSANNHPETWPYPSRTHHQYDTDDGEQKRSQDIDLHCGGLLRDERIKALFTAALGAIGALAWAELFYLIAQFGKWKGWIDCQWGWKSGPSVPG